MEQDQLRRIGKLIDDLELCHHKAHRHVALIVEAIGREHTAKGYQAREYENRHPATRMWQNAIEVLSAWVAGGYHEGRRDGCRGPFRQGARRRRELWSMVEQVSNGTGEQ